MSRLDTLTGEPMSAQQPGKAPITVKQQLISWTIESDEDFKDLQGYLIEGAEILMQVQGMGKTYIMTRKLIPTKLQVR